MTGAACVFVVRDIAASVGYYRDSLGFTAEFQFGQPIDYAALCRDAVGLHLIAATRFQREGSGWEPAHVWDEHPGVGCVERSPMRGLALGLLRLRRGQQRHGRNHPGADAAYVVVGEECRAAGVQADGDRAAAAHQRAVGYRRAGAGAAQLLGGD